MKLGYIFKIWTLVFFYFFKFLHAQSPQVNWQELSTSPPIYSNTYLAYDENLEQLILFGGLTTPNKTPTNETWILSERKWIKLSPIVSPSARSHGTMVYDETSKRLILFGGEDENGLLLNDTWTWDGTN